MFCKIRIFFVIFSFCILANDDALEMKTTKPPPPKISAKFLLAVNDTWDPKG